MHITAPNQPLLTIFTTDGMHSKISLTSWWDNFWQTGSFTSKTEQVYSNKCVYFTDFNEYCLLSITVTLVKSTNLVKSACSSQDNVRVFHLNHSLSQTHQIGSDSNSTTCYLQEHKKWLRDHMGSSISEKSVAYSHHTNCNNLLIGLRRFASNGARASQVLNPKTFFLPDDVSDDVPIKDGHSDEDQERENLHYPTHRS